jgi:hypothetical protein
MSEKLANETTVIAQPSTPSHERPAGPKLRSEVIQRWWPTTQSLDLVEGPVEQVAEAVQSEVSRFTGREKLGASWQRFPDLDSAFAAAADFANVPTVYLVLPSRSRWTVLWNNSFLCDGYDSLCWCLTNNHHFTTIHWSAHDAWTTFQAGSAFYHRRWDGAKVVQRVVQTAQEDRRWTFYESGEPLAQEDIEGYRDARKRDRLNERRMADLLERFGARPWQEDFYAVSEAPSFVLLRESAPATLLHRSRAEALQIGADGEPERLRERRLSARR